MLLCEILTGSSTMSALDQLINNANKMSVLYVDRLTNQIRNLYAEGQHEDMYRTTKNVVGRSKGKWFAENYLSTSSHRASPTAGLKFALLELANDPKFASVRSKLKTMGSLEIYASADLRQEKEASFGQHLNFLESLLPSTMKEMASKAPGEYRQRLEQASLRLQNSVNNFNKLWDKLQTEWDSEWGKDADKKRQTAADKQQRSTQRQASGSQSQQVEELIGQVLGTIDKRIAAEIRPIVMKSDNKLLTLQQELGKRGIKV